MRGDDQKEAFEISSLSYTWPGANRPTLSIEEFSLSCGENLYLRGPSGSGKSTLLSAIAAVIDVRPGEIFVTGVDLGRLAGAARDRFRVDHIGLIFQMFNLIPWLSAIENVLLPCRFSARRRERAGRDPTQTAEQLLAELGMGDRTLQQAPAARLSVGQQQRVAAARALIGSPNVILADEPTSALDEEAKSAFVDLLRRECAAVGASLMFVSHDSDLERHFDRAVNMADINAAFRRC